jgi:UDP-N-acetylglucosamine transferase subunit ALG13
LQIKNKKFVFVSVGSTDFDDLVRAVDFLVPILGLDGIMQIGHGKYKPINLPFFRFAISLKPFYQKASLAIAHGGLATTMEILKEGLPLVSVSNPDRYDKHQDDLLKIMEEKNHLIWCRQIKKLKESINLALSKDLAAYHPPKCKIHLHVNRFLNQ